MKLIEVKSITANRIVNVGKTVITFGKDKLCLVDSKIAEELVKNPNYSLTGNQSEYKEIKKVVVEKKEIEKVIETKNTVEKVTKKSKGTNSTKVK